MFGYVVANLEKLTPAQKERYSAVYCGLCKSLGKQHGLACRMTLTYDMTFLILLLSSLDRTELAEAGSFRCGLHPVKKRQYISNQHTAYAADMNVLLAYSQRMDDWQDERKLLSLVQAKAISSQIEQIKEKYPRQNQALVDGLQALSALESAGETNPDLPATAFGSILAAIFAKGGHAQETQLHAFGDKLGRFIYLMDAVVDLKEDIKAERYNPLVAVDSSRHEEILEVMMADCTQAFLELPMIRDQELMENILYSGVWTSYQAKRKGENKA